MNDKHFPKPFFNHFIQNSPPPIPKWKSLPSCPILKISICLLLKKFFLVVQAMHFQARLRSTVFFKVIPYG